MKKDINAPKRKRKGSWMKYFSMKRRPDSGKQLKPTRADYCRDQNRKNKSKSGTRGAGMSPGQSRAYSEMVKEGS